MIKKIPHFHVMFFSIFAGFLTASRRSDFGECQSIVLCSSSPRIKNTRSITILFPHRCWARLLRDIYKAREKSSRVHLTGSFNSSGKAKPISSIWHWKCVLLTAGKSVCLCYPPLQNCIYSLRIVIYILILWVDWEFFRSCFCWRHSAPGTISSPSGALQVIF